MASSAMRENFELSRPVRRRRDDQNVDINMHCIPTRESTFVSDNCTSRRIRPHRKKEMSDGAGSLSRMSPNKVAAVMALAATLVQIYWRVSMYWHNDARLARHFSTVRDLMQEVRWRQPIRRIRRRREIMSLLADYPDEIFNYRRVYWEVVAWALLLLASAYAAFGTLSQR